MNKSSSSSSMYLSLGFHENWYFQTYTYYHDCCSLGGRTGWGLTWWGGGLTWWGGGFGVKGARGAGVEEGASEGTMGVDQ
jgi:hypothetical protein